MKSPPLCLTGVLLAPLTRVAEETVANGAWVAIAMDAYMPLADVFLSSLQQLSTKPENGQGPSFSLKKKKNLTKERHSNTRS